MTKTSRACSKCIAMRWFFMAAFPLIGMIYFQPEGAMRIASRAPSIEMFGYLFAVACVTLFAVKWIAFKRETALAMQRAETRDHAPNGPS